MQRLEALRQKRKWYYNVKKRTRYDNKFKVKLVLEVLKGEKTLNPCACTSVRNFRLQMSYGGTQQRTIRISH